MNYRRLSSSTDYFVFESLADCEPMDQALMHAAMDKVPLAYAPYSRFHVGAALRLELGVIFSGNNQENAAFPLGSCAERVTCGYAKAHYPDSIIEAMAIYVSPLDHQLDHATSDYLFQGATQWLNGWRKRNWQKKEGQPIANQDLWHELDQALQQHAVYWINAKGEEGEKLPGLREAAQLAITARQG